MKKSVQIIINQGKIMAKGKRDKKYDKINKRLEKLVENNKII